MQSLRVKRFEKYNLNEGREMFLFMSKTNGNDFINLQCISIRIKHLFWGGGGGGGRGSYKIVLHVLLEGYDELQHNHR